MLYVKRLESGIAQITYTKPSEECTYVSLEMLPDGEGILKMTEEGRLYYDPIARVEAVEPELPKPQLTTEEIMLDMMTELEYRTSLLELGIGGAL